MNENKNYYEIINNKLNKRINELEILYKNSIEKIAEQQKIIETLQNQK